MGLCECQPSDEPRNSSVQGLRAQGPRESGPGGGWAPRVVFSSPPQPMQMVV